MADPAHRRLGVPDEHPAAFVIVAVVLVVLFGILMAAVT
jgi:uncharacterized protein (DUF983 family)